MDLLRLNSQGEERFLRYGTAGGAVPSVEKAATAKVHFYARTRSKTNEKIISLGLLEGGLRNAG